MGLARGMTVDHVFLAVSRGGPEVDALVDAGFAEGPPNAHRGQGTACRRVFFDNAYLEFLWLEDHVEATSPRISRTGLGARLGEGLGARSSDGLGGGLAEGRGEGPRPSRIGICLRLPAGLDAPPVQTWAYRPPYLPSGMAIPVASSSVDPEEPLLFFLPAGVAGTRTWPAHPNGAEVVSGISVGRPAGRSPSPALEWLMASGLVAFDPAPTESLHVELDAGHRGCGLTLDTPTPLVLRW